VKRTTISGPRRRRLTPEVRGIDFEVPLAATGDRGPRMAATAGGKHRRHVNSAKQFCKAVPALLSKPTPSSPILAPIVLKETANSCKSFIAATRVPRRISISSRQDDPLTRSEPLWKLVMSASLRRSLPGSRSARGQRLKCGQRNQCCPLVTCKLLPERLATKPSMIRYAHPAKGEKES
jgi:hypothetical protein